MNFHKSLGSLESLHGKAESLLNVLSFSFPELDALSGDLAMDFTDCFVKNPFLKLPDDRFIPFDGKWADDLLWISLYYKIAECYDDKIDFYNLFGYLFESYVSHLAEMACNFNDKYQYVPEFSYGKPLRKSPDAMISSRKMLAITSRRIKLIVSCA